jgi:creatinine amidohydrolase
MPAHPGSLLITDLTWADVRDHLEREPRLIVPVGACDQYGPHLPIGAASLVTEAFAKRISEESGILRAPTIGYGVNVPTIRVFAGSATLRQKTLHAFLNDLLAAWEDDGFTEFILLTAHGYDAHVEATATVTGTTARVRVIELLNIDLGGMLTGTQAAEHGGEILTSLMLHLHPEQVRSELAREYWPPNSKGVRGRRIVQIPEDSLGSIGDPTLATPETGRKLFDFICERIRSRVLDLPE